MSPVLNLLILAPVYMEGPAEDEEQPQWRKLVSHILQDGTVIYQLCLDLPSQLRDIEPTSADATAATGELSVQPNLDRNFLTFPFVTDRGTASYIKSRHTRVMFIMRGLPGSGKSSIVSAIKTLFSNVVACSADSYLYQPDGSYKFDKTQLEAAHMYCQHLAKQSCKSKVPIIIIDNTNVKRWELKVYLDLANSSGYVVVLLQPKTPWRFDPEELASRNKHGLTVEVLERKVRMFQDMIPLYYGWFLNERQSKLLARLGSSMFQECLQSFPAMKQDFLKKLNIKVDQNSEETVKEILLEYYASDSSINPLLHCTSLFCAWGRVPESRDYHQRPDVQLACGQMFVLDITGLVITTQTLCARVGLNHTASAFFDRPEEKEWSSPELKTRSRQLRPVRVSQDSDLRKSRVSDRLTLSQRPVNDLGERKALSEMFPWINYKDKARSAHFTIKTARGVKAQEVNFDLLRACDTEADKMFAKTDLISLSRGQACYYGNGVCCIYFEKPLKFKSLFSGYY